ncbi:MAG: choloylglycine hydrolase [Bacilli bacterium]
MCTALSKQINDNHYFGRNLDLNYPFKESIIVVSRLHPLTFKKVPTLLSHHAIYGIGIVKDNYPFYFDCANEYGLTFAGLNFPNNAVFYPVDDNKINIAPYELPLYLLGKYKTVKEVREALKEINICDIPFSKELPLSTLHYIISDKTDCIVIEQTKEKMNIYDNPFGVLTNNPPFPYHALNINNYSSLTNKEPTNRFAKDLNLFNYGKAMGAIGLPGDSSPASRFVKATFLLHNIRFSEDDDFNISQMLHILNNVSTLKGECVLDDGSEEYTVYSSMYNLNKKELFVRAYERGSIFKYTLNNSLDNDKLDVIEIDHSIKFINL